MPAKRIDVARFPSLNSDDRKRLLLRAAKSGLEYTAADFLGGDHHDPVMVVDIDGEVDVGGRVQALHSAAGMLGLQIYDPTVIAGDAGAAYEMWGVPMEDCKVLTSPISLGRGATAKEASETGLLMLESLVGGQVLSLADWGVVCGPSYAHLGRQRRERKPPVMAYKFRGVTVATWAAAGVHTWKLLLTGDGEVLPEEEMGNVLEAHGSLQRRPGAKRSTPSYELTVVRHNDLLYAPFHDLVNAAREGVLLEGVSPWPKVRANTYVIHREFIRYMRKRGWRFPWREEEPEKKLRLYGRTWVKDNPLDETL